MNNVISAEKFKLRHSTLTKVVFIIIALSSAGTVLLIRAMNSLMDFLNDNSKDAQVTAMGFDNYNGFTAMSHFMGFFFMLLVILQIVDIAVKDYSSHTMKNLCSCGIARTKIFFGKLITAYVMTLVLFIIGEAISAITGTIVFGWGSDISVLSIVKALLINLLIVLIIVTIFFSLAVITKSSKVAVIVGIIYIEFEAMIYMGVNLIFGTKIDGLMTIAATFEVNDISNTKLITLGAYALVAAVLAVIAEKAFNHTDIN